MNFQDINNIWINTKIHPKGKYLLFLILDFGPAILSTGYVLVYTAAGLAIFKQQRNSQLSGLSISEQKKPKVSIVVITIFWPMILTKLLYHLTYNRWAVLWIRRTCISTTMHSSKIEIDWIKNEYYFYTFYPGYKKKYFLLFYHEIICK